MEQQKTNFWNKLQHASFQKSCRWIVIRNALLVFPDVITTLLYIPSLLSWRCWTMVGVYRTWIHKAIARNHSSAFPWRYRLYEPEMTMFYYQQALYEIGFFIGDVFAIISGLVTIATLVRARCLFKNFAYASHHYYRNVRTKHSKYFSIIIRSKTNHNYYICI